VKKFIIIFILILLGLGVYHYPNISKALNAATGYSAKYLCSGHFVSGFTGENIAREALEPINQAFSLVNYQFNEADKSATTTIIGAFERKAIYRQGLGCTLLISGQENLSTSISPLSFEPQSTTEAWPKGLAAVNYDQADVNYELISQAIDRGFSESEPNGKRNVKAIAIIYKGQLIAERYAEGVTLNTPLLSWSMAKSITGLQVGLLTKSGKLDVFSNANVPAWHDETDPRSKITLDMLMRMSSGLEFNETYDINSDVSRMLSVEKDSGKFAASKPLEFDIDSHWSYSSGTSNIISGIIKRTIGGDLQQYYEYTQKNLFIPLGINTAISETDASDTFVGSSYFYASARDYAKLGQLLLQNGRWDDQQILPKHWVKYLTTATKTQPLNKYGAQYWLNQNPDSKEIDRSWPTVPDDAYYMGGYQGQYVVVIPSKELIVVRFGFTKPGTNEGIERLISDTVAAIETNP
jgi:CubicO group peptidase (beta-lactamase class C family)